MANSYASSKFDIDTDINVAGLITLKGSAIATTDYIYISNAATVTIEQNLSIAGFYIGNNVAKTASVKTGHVVMNAGLTLALNTNTAHEGFSGEGTTSTVTINGTAASRCTVTCANAAKVSNYYMKGVITAEYTDFTNMLALFGTAAHIINNCTFTGTSACSGYYLDGVVFTTLPASWCNNSFIGMHVAWNDSTTATPINYGDFFRRFPMKFTGSSASSTFCQIDLRFGTGGTAISRYFTALLTTNPQRIYRKLE